MDKPKALFRHALSNEKSEELFFHDFEYIGYDK